MNKIDKTLWKSFTFGQIASNISERVEPGKTDLSIYFGLEHLDSNSIHITRFGKPSDVQGTKLKVYKGDIIFGKRRAYQRKAAIAEFDGICSAHAMVLRAKKEVILPELFPFFLHSDAFMNRAIDISEGSLSPTIKWKTLAKQTFTIPPLNEQKKIADLLWSGDKYLQSLKSLLLQLNSYLSTSLIHYEQTSPLMELKNIIDIKFGERITQSKNMGSKYPVYGGGGESFKTDEFNHEDEFVISRFALSSKCVRYVEGKFWLLDSGFTFSINDQHTNTTSKMFIGNFLLNSQNKIYKCARGGAQKNINIDQFLKLKVPFPEMKNQNKINIQITQIQSSYFTTMSIIEHYKKVITLLMNNLLT